MIMKTTSHPHPFSLLLMIGIFLFSTNFLTAQEKVKEKVKDKVEKKIEKKVEKKVEKKDHLVKMMKIESTVLEETRIVVIVIVVVICSGSVGAHANKRLSEFYSAGDSASSSETGSTIAAGSSGSPGNALR